jgi:hypothetical protein
MQVYEYIIYLVYNILSKYFESNKFIILRHRIGKKIIVWVLRCKQSNETQVSPVPQKLKFDEAFLWLCV